MSSGEEQRTHLERLIEKMGKEPKDVNVKEGSDLSANEKEEVEEDEEECDEGME